MSEHRKIIVMELLSLQILTSSQPVRSILSILDLATAGPFTLEHDLTGLPRQDFVGLLGSDFTDKQALGLILRRLSSLSFGPIVLDLIT